MKSDLELTNLIEAYLRGELSETERADFERLRFADSRVDHLVVEHNAFMQQMADYGERKQLMAEMNAIHDTIDVAAVREEVTPRTSSVVTLWRKYRMSTAVAASVALIAVFSTLSLTGYFSKSNVSNYSALRRINDVQNQVNSLKNTISRSTIKGPANPGQFGGTGFALSENGYILTNYHVINGADSVYIQNSKGDSYKVRKVFIDPGYDIAVLKIEDPSFEPLKSLPYTFKETPADIGENVFTYGYPKDDGVYNRGYLSSRNGYTGDTTAYQVDISVNPGNSGGPLLDDKGNIIGIINGKQTQSDGAAFAIKSEYILKSIASIPQDSLTAKFQLNKKNGLAGLKKTDQIKRLQDYIFMIKVY